MKQPTMVYKYPGTMHKCNVTKDSFDYKVVEGEAEAGEKSAVDEALANGWSASTKEAKDAAQNVPTLAPAPPVDNAPPTREELEKKADELHIEYTDADEDELLQLQIEEALTNPIKNEEFL